MERIVFNTGRLRVNSIKARETLQDALDAGVRWFDHNAQANDLTWLLANMLPDDARVMVRIGYAKTEPGSTTVTGFRRVNEELSHSLANYVVKANVEGLKLHLPGKVDRVFLHNPEQLNPSVNKRVMLGSSLQIIRDAGFKAGLSTSEPGKVQDWLEVDDIAELASVRTPACAFDGASALKALDGLATDHPHVEVVAYRPFLALDGSAPRRLTDLTKNDLGASGVHDYKAIYARALRYFTPKPEITDEDTIEGCKTFTDLVSELDSALSGFSSFEEYEYHLGSRIAPMLHSRFTELDEDSADLLKDFFEAYGATVRRSTQKATRALAESTPAVAGVGALRSDERMADWALRRVLARTNLSKVSIAFEAPSDVVNVARILAGINNN
ncbi:hypothetical protein M885DRAFT_521275, partial [Pelagophyceae sp. CCMP2097]